MSLGELFLAQVRIQDTTLSQFRSRDFEVLAQRYRHGELGTQSS